MFGTLIIHRPPQHFIHAFADDDPLSRRERDEGVGPRFDISDQFGIQDERFSIQTGQLDHDFLSGVLTLQRQQLVQHLLGGGDDPRIPAIHRRRQDQVDQVASDVGVRQFGRPGNDRPDALLAGISHDGQPRVHAGGIEVFALLFQPGGIAEPGQADLSQIAGDSVAEYPADGPILAHNKTGQHARGGAILA